MTSSALLDLRTDKAAASLPPHFGFKIEREKFVRGAGNFPLSLVAISPIPDFAGALAHMEAEAAPAPFEELVGLLATMAVKVQRARISDGDSDLQLATYAEALGEYPRAAVLAVLKAWPTKSRWWPTWKELHDELEPLAAPGRSVRAAIKAEAVRCGQIAPWPVAMLAKRLTS